MGTAMITLMFWCFEPLTFIVSRDAFLHESPAGSPPPNDPPPDEAGSPKRHLRSNSLSDALKKAAPADAGAATAEAEPKVGRHTLTSFIIMIIIKAG